MKDWMTVSQLATLSGTPPDTLRYYEKERLLTPATRTAAGYRLYGQTEFKILKFIQHAKAVGYSLNEIRYLLNLRMHKSDHSCQVVKDYTAKKLEEIEAKIREMSKIRDYLQIMHDNCCGGDESAESCSILQMLEADDSTFYTSHSKSE